MANYLTRVELHDAKWPDDYDRLHVAMERKGFSKTILGIENGVQNTFQLPTAEYYRQSNLALSQILIEGQEAANTIGRKFGIIVAECTSLSWEGLPVVKK